MNRDPTATLERVYQRIHAERMDGIPILNGHIRVEAMGFRPWGQGWAGILITPWCMNLMLMHATGEPLDHRTGQSISHRLGEADYRFTVGEEAEIGVFQSCSLFSPMFEFPDHATAVAVAKAILSQLFDQPAQTSAVDLSRRHLLQGQWTRNRSASL